MSDRRRSPHGCTAPPSGKLGETLPGRSWSKLFNWPGFARSVRQGLCAGLVMLVLAGCAHRLPPDSPGPAAREPDVIYIPSGMPVVDAMLDLAKVRDGDILYDLGSGDGRIPIVAAQRFALRAVGVEIDPALVRRARANAVAAGVVDRVTFRQEDLFLTDFSEATVVMLYLYADVNERLRPRLIASLKPGTRIVSHDYLIGDWMPEKIVMVGDSRIFLWTVPARP